MSEHDEGQLERLGRRLARWRVGHGGRGRRIPEWVWQEASGLASMAGVPAVARALRLAPWRLTVRARGAEGGAGPAFVELDAAGLMFSELTVEIEGRSGRRARIRGGDPEIVARVARVLLDGERA